MNILLINHYAGSEQHGMEYRPYYLAREWVKSGHNVLILAASFSHIRKSQPALGNQRSATESIDNITYKWYKTPSYNKNGIHRVINITKFLIEIYFDSKKITHQFKPDVVIASSTYPMDVWIARRISRLSNAKLIYEVHDLWPLSPIEVGGMSKWNPFILWVQWAENYAYRHVDKVISILPNALEHMSNHGLASNKYAYIPNGFAVESSLSTDSELPKELLSILSEARKNNFFIIGYAGTHGLSNSLDTLLTAASLLKDKKIYFILIGDGQEKIRLQLRVQSEQLNNVSLLPPISKRQVQTFLGEVDAAYLGAPKLDLYRFGVSPNKMLDYMMSQVPIIYAIESGNDPVGQARCGIQVAAEDPTSLANGIESLRNESPDVLSEMGINGRNYALNNYRYDILANQFINEIKSIRK